MRTADQNLPYQQNLNRPSIAVIVVAARSNRIESLRELGPGLCTALASIKPRTLVKVEA